jgi:O-antigen/teichoic acid export membrane protein
VQAALLPKLAALASEGKNEDFRSGMRKLLLIVVALGTVGTLGATFIGPWGGKKLFGDKWILGDRDMLLLTLGAATFIIALTLAQGLIALRAYPQAAFAWIAGIVVFLGTVALGHDLFLRNELGFVTGGGIAAALMGLFLMQQMHRGGGTIGDLVEVIETETLEI